MLHIDHYFNSGLELSEVKVDIQGKEPQNQPPNEQTLRPANEGMLALIFKKLSNGGFDSAMLCI